MDLLQEYLLVPLDIFLKIPHNEISKLEAWLYFIASDKMADIKKVCDAYPEFFELYSEVFKFRYNPRELVGMFSEALKILDQDTVQYMIDDMRKEIDSQKEELEAKDKKLESQQEELESKDKVLKSQADEIESLKEKIAILEGR